MNLVALFQIIARYPHYKIEADQIRAQILACRVQGELCADQVRARLPGLAPLWSYLQAERSNYLERCEQNKKYQQQGYSFLLFGSAQYPRGFYLTEDPPLVISCLGTPPNVEQACLAVVGSREPREESMLWMEKEFTGFLQRQNINVVSGGARGIDQRAHALALRQQRPTTVLIPAGLGQLYPADLKNWVKPVLDQGGCFLSEYEFQQPMRKFLFHHRNRLIAALAQMILVVEARRRSGTMITAQLGANWGRPVLVVPGHPQDSHFAGCLDLLAEGATLARDAQDLDSCWQAELWSSQSDGVSVGTPLWWSTIGSGEEKYLK